MITKKRFWIVFWIIFVAVFLVVTFLVAPFVFKAISGYYPPGFPRIDKDSSEKSDKPLKETKQTNEPEAATVPQPSPVQIAILPEMAKLTDPPGGHVSDIAFAPTNPETVFLVSNVNAMGIWKSDDAGESWQRILGDEDIHGTTHTNTIATHPSNSNIILATDLHGHIKKTSDSGNTWRDVYGADETDISMFAVAFSPSKPEIVYAGDSEGNILKSINSGETWNIMGRASSYGVGSLAVSMDKPNVVYAATKGGVYKSEDGGASWSAVLRPLPNPDVVEVAVSSNSVFAASSSGVFVSGDEGKNWEQTLKIHSHSIQSALSDENVVYAGTEKGVYKSIDGGNTWETMSAGIQFLDIGPLAVHPKDSDIVIFGTNIWEWTYHEHEIPVDSAGEGIYKTIDGGISWKKKTKGFVDRDLIAVNVDYNNPDIVYLGTECSRGLFKTENSGASWRFVRGGPEDHKDIAHYSMRIASNKNSKIFLTGRLGFGISTDGAKSWRSAITRSHFHGVGISPHNPDIVFTGTSSSEDVTDSKAYSGGIILRSKDGGESWQEVGKGFPSGAETSIHDFAFDAKDSNIVYVSSSSHEFGLDPTPETVGIYKSLDLGESWREINNGLTTKEVDYVVADPKTAGLVYAGTANGVFKSVDYGEIWKQTGLEKHVHSLLIDPSETNIIYAGTNEGLYWSDDAGETWQKINSVESEEVHGLSMDSKGRALYAVVEGIGVYRGVKA